MRLKNHTIIIIILLMILSNIFVTVSVHADGGGWWDSNWQYYKVCNINNNGYSGFYQMKLNVSYSSGGNVSCEGHCQSDFDDLRFVEVDNSTVLPYWIEEKVDGSYALVWVNVSAQAMSDGKILMYYGNSGASSASDGNATFEEYFDYTTTSGWTCANSGTIEAIGDRLRYYDGNNVAGGKAYHAVSVSSNQWCMETLIQSYDRSTYVRGAVMITSDTAYSNRYALVWIPNQPSNDIEYEDGSSYYTLYTNFQKSTDYKLKIFVNQTDSATGVNYYIYNSDESSLLGSATGKAFRNNPTDVNYLFLGDFSTDYYVDLRLKYLFFRKWASTEPSWSSFGSEQSQGGWTNTAPVISNENPSNASTDVNIQPVVNVTVTDADGNLSTVDFFISTDGNNWTHVQTNSSVLNTSVSYHYTSASSYSTVYYWKVTANDTHDNTSKIYHFTTMKKGFVSSNGIFEYLNKPCAFYYQGTYNRAYICFIDNTGKVKIKYYDYDAGVFSNEVTVHDIGSNDDHAAPTLIVNDTGHIVVFWTEGHSDPLYVSVSTYSENITSWETPVLIHSGDCSYPKPWQDNNGTYHVTYRYTTATYYRYVYHSWSTDLSSWSTETLLDFGSDCWIYQMQYQEPSNPDYVHIVATRKDTSLNKREKLYYMYTDDGGTTWKNDTGTEISLSASTSEMSVVWDETNYLRQFDVYADSNHNVYILATKDIKSDSTPTLHMIYKSSGTWANDSICDLGEFYNVGEGNAYVTGACIDRGNPNVVYVSAYDTDNDMQVWQKQTGWSKVEDITTDGTTWKIRPMPVYNKSGRVLWCEGSYNGFTSWNMKIYWHQFIISNNPPSLSGESPTNGSTNVNPIPSLHVICSDSDGDTMTAYWYSNSSGSWVQFASNNSISSGTNITQTNSNFTSPGTTYYWSVNLTDGTDWCNETYHFTTRNQYIPDPPTGFTATTYNTTQINLTWTKNNSADTTYIERNTVSSWSRGSGTIVYNNTGTSYSDTGLNPHTTYYYQAWSYNATDNVYSSSYASDSDTTLNSAPTVSNPYPSNGSIGISLQPVCHIDVSDSDGDSLDVYWYENSTGSWVLRQTNSSVGNGTYYWTFTQADDYNTKYWWKVAVNDSVDNVTKIYHFTTETSVGSPVVITNETTGVEETNATLHGYLSDDGGEPCTVWFEYGKNTTYGNNITLSNLQYVTNTSEVTYDDIVYSYPYVFVSTGGTIYVYIFSDKSNLVLIDTYHSSAYSDYFEDMEYDSTTGYLYTANTRNATVFSFDGTTLTRIDDIALSDLLPYSSYMNTVSYNDSYVFIGADRPFIIALSFDGTSLSYICNVTCDTADANYQRDVYDMTYHNNILFVLTIGTGVEAWSFNGTSFSHIDTFRDSELPVSSWDSSSFYVYNDYVVVGTYEGLYILEWNGTNFNYKELYDYYPDSTYSNITYISGYGNLVFSNRHHEALSVYSISNDQILLIEQLETEADYTEAIDAGNGYVFAEYGANDYCYVFSYRFSAGDLFTYNLTGLNAGTLYHYRAVANNSNSTVYGSDKTFFTKPFPPANVTITSYNNTTISFTWTKGQGANHTVILRKTTGYSTSPTDGIEVYNNTGTTYTDAVTSGLKYYYSFYSYVEENSLYRFSEKVDISQEIPPEIPTNISYKVVPPNQLNITWTKGNHSDATILRVSSSSQPTSPTDGTLLYNGSLEYYLYTVTEDFYITLFSYNATSHLYSTGVPLDAYFVWLNCYNENTGNKLDGYSVVFTNPTGSSVYEKDNCTSPTLINVSDIPTGEKISVSVEKNGYSPRSYVFKILNITSNYFIDVFLLPIETTTEECTLISFVDTKIVTNPNIDNVVSLSKTLETISGVEIYNKSLYPEYNLQSFIDSKSVTNTSVNLTINLTYPLEQIYSVEVYNETLYGTYGGWLFVSNDKYTYNTTQVEISSSVFDSNTTIVRVTYYYLNSISSTGGWVTVDADKYTYNTTSVTVNQTILDSNITTIRVSYYYEYCTEGAEQKYLYQIEVINQNNLAVPDVKVTIARYINETFGFKNISILYTDGAGHITIYLKPFTLYKFILEKTGYQNETADWTPNDAIFTHTFLMESTQYETPSNYTPPLITITRNGTTITVSYYDTLGLTLDVNTILYYYNATGSLIQVSSVQNTSENNINIKFKNTNTTYTYRIIIHYNQTIGNMIYTKTINPIYTSITTPATLNTILVAILGQAGAFLWTNLILFLAFAVMMFSADKKHAGKYLILIGGIMAFVAIIGFHSAFSASIPTLFVIVGIILEWINARRGG